MARENRILGIFPRREKRSGLPAPEFVQGIPGVTDNAFLYTNKKTYISAEKSLKLSAVYRAVDLISGAVAMLPVTLYQDGKRVENDLSYLLNFEPNNINTRFGLFKLVEVDILQRGNAFLLIVRSGNAVEELRYVNPEDVTIMHDKKANRKRFRVKEVGEVDDSDMLHFMNMTTDGIKGISVLEAARRSMGIAWSSEESADNFFERGGAVSGVLAGKAVLTEAQKLQIRQQWKEIMAPDVGGVAVIGNDMTFTPVHASAADSQLLESRGFNVAEIARFYGVSPTLLGDLTRSSYATFEATTLDFLTNCLQPRLTNIEQELNRKLLLRREKQVLKMHFAYDTEDLLRCTKTEMAQYYRDMINNGVMTVNEVRRKLDLEPVEGGDENYIQLNMTTLTGVQNNNTNGNEN